MTTETTQTPVDKALAAQGATQENLDAGAAGNAGAPAAPAAPSNEPPKKEKLEGMDEENGVVVTPDPAKEAADKAAADKATAAQAAADKEAAGPLKSYAVITDSPAAAAAIDLLKEAGVGPNAASEFFDKALKSGNPADVDVAGLEAKIGKAKATLVMAGVNAHFAQAKAQGEATVKLVHDVFGNEAGWNTVKAWAQTTEKGDTAFKKQVDSIRGLIDQGGVAAELGAKELLRLYNSAPNNKGLGTNKLAVGDSTGTVIGTVLNRADYLTELKAAHGRGASASEIKQLDARRIAGKRAGI